MTHEPTQSDIDEALIAGLRKGDFICTRDADGELRFWHKDNATAAA